MPSWSLRLKKLVTRILQDAANVDPWIRISVARARGPIEKWVNTQVDKRQIMPAIECK